MDTVLNAAFIGCGSIARIKHLPLSAEDPRVRIKTLYNRSRGAAELCKAQFGTPDTVIAEDAEDIFSDRDIDLVFISTANDSHAQYAVRALEAGKHVICEKPMALCPEQAKSMLLAAQQHRRLLHVSYQNRYTPQAIYAKRLVDEGKVGKVYYAKAYALRRRAMPTWGAAASAVHQGGGPLIDIGSHSIDLALWLSGGFDAEYAAGTAYNMLVKQGSEANHWGPWDTEKSDVEDCALGFVVMKNGMTLSVEASYALNIAVETEASADLFGVCGGIELRQEPRVKYIHEFCGQMCVTENELQKTPRALSPSTQSASASSREHDAVIARILAGDVSDTDAVQAYQVCRIVDAIYKSAAQKRPIYFD